MKGGTAILVLGGVVVLVGGVVLLVATSSKTSTKPRPSSNSAAGSFVGGLITSLGGAAIAALSSKGSQPSTTGQPISTYADTDAGFDQFSTDLFGPKL